MSKIERLTIELPAHLVAGLRESVRIGAFASESEAIEVVLRSWYGDEGIEEPDVETLRAFVAEGIADMDARRMSKAEDVYARVLAHIDALAAARLK